MVERLTQEYAPYLTDKGARSLAACTLACNQASQTLRELGVLLGVSIMVRSEVALVTVGVVARGYHLVGCMAGITSPRSSLVWSGTRLSHRVLSVWLVTTH